MIRFLPATGVLVVLLAATFAGTGCTKTDSVRNAEARQEEPVEYQFDFGPGPAASGYTPVRPSTRYTEARGYGFLEGAELSGVADGSGEASTRDALTSNAPFYFSVAVPEGNYRVRVTLGSPTAASQATVKAESRRLMLENIDLTSGQFVTRTFTVNIRNSQIEGGGEVHLKDREIGAFHWDDQLTLEFNGAHPAVASLDIEKVDDAVTVYLAGNSTVTDQTREPWAAWGQMLPRFFGPEVAVANHAESGEALKAFAAENRLKKLMSQIGEGDYLFIQFAHNDQKPGGAHVEPFDGYQRLLRRFISKARSRGAHTVLATSMHRRRFDDNGEIVNTLGDYPEAMRQTAQETGVPLIDLHAMSETFYEALGPEHSKEAFVHYPAGTFPDQEEALKDNTHHSAYGAYELARAVVSGIRAHVPGLAQHLREDVRPFDPAQPDEPATWTLPRSPRASVATPEGN